MTFTLCTLKWHNNLQLIQLWPDFRQRWSRTRFRLKILAKKLGELLQPTARDNSIPPQGQYNMSKILNDMIFTFLKCSNNKIDFLYCRAGSLTISYNNYPLLLENDCALYSTVFISVCHSSQTTHLVPVGALASPQITSGS